MDHHKKTVYFFYALFYFLTNVIGGILIGTKNLIDYPNQLNSAIIFYVQNEFVYGSKLKLFWELLFLPFIILPITLLFKLKFKKIKKFYVNVGKSKFTISLFIVFSFFIYEIIFSGNLSLLTSLNFLETKNNYDELIIGRNHYFSSLGNIYFGILYMTLPFFSHISLYKYLKSKSNFWFRYFILLFITITYFNISINQKAPLVIYFLSIIISYSFCKKIKIRSYFIFFLLSFFLINTLMVFTLGQESWNGLFTLFHAFFRAPAALPYYVNLYPDLVPFTGIDFGIKSLLRLPNITATDNIDVHTFLWGQSFKKFGIMGSVAAPFQFRAYAQAGLTFSFFSIILAGLYMRFFTFIYRNEFFGKSLTHAFIVQSLINLYYLSQTHIKDVLWSSYGICWVFFGVIICIVVDYTFRLLKI